MYYVVVVIGCIECEERSGVIGIFTNKEQAENIAENYNYEPQNAGQYEIEIYEVNELNKIIAV